MNGSDQSSPDGLEPPRRYWAVGAILLAMILSILDIVVVNVALPTIAHDLHVSPAAAIWIVNGYQIALVALLLPLAALGEIVGYRRVYLTGLVVFAVGSVACTFAPSLAVLTMARALQGMGAAGILALNETLVRFVYPHRLLGRGLGLNALVLAVTAAIGPTIASSILAFGSWRWLFAVNLPIAFAALAIGIGALPHVEPPQARFDLLSAVFNVLCLGLLLVGVEALTRLDTLAAPELIGAGAAAIFLFKRSCGQSRPLAPVDLIRIPAIARALAATILTYASQMMAMVATPFILQYGGGRSAVAAGLLMTPLPIGTAIAARVVGGLADRHAAPVLSMIGIVALTTGLVLLAAMPAQPSPWDLGWRLAICGFGFGFFQTPNNRAILLTAPRARAGSAGGMLATARLLGLIAGATIVALMFRLSGRQYGSTLPFAVAAALTAGAGLITFFRLGDNPAAAPTPSDAQTGSD